MDGAKQHVAAAPSASIKVAVHPLVVMNISDQYTRAKVQSQGEFSIIGALLGQQSGREVEVCNSFDLKCHMIDGTLIVDLDFLRQREAQYKQVFKDVELLGWYTTGCTPPDQGDLRLLRQLTVINENPVWLKFNAQSQNVEQPIRVYECVFDVASDGPSVQFVEVSNSLAAEEAERICVDHVARLRGRGTTSESQLAAPMTCQASAIKMLHTRIMMLQDYIKAVHEGSLPANLDMLRSISSLCNRLPLMTSDQLIGHSNEQSNEVMLMTYLATLTKSCATLNEVITKTSQMEERPAGGGRKSRLPLTTSWAKTGATPAQQLS